MLDLSLKSKAASSLMADDWLEQGAKQIYRSWLTVENLEKAEVVNFEESISDRRAALRQPLSAEVIKGDNVFGSFFPVDEYPDGVDLLENEIGATVTMRAMEKYLVRYTELP